MTDTILISGATGTVGSSLREALEPFQSTVRAMSRQQTEFSNAEPVVADLRDPESLEPALTGVDALFLNSPSTPDAADLQIRFADKARRAGVRKLVLLSQYGADSRSPVRYLRWHGRVEEHVRDLGFDLTILRPNLYMQGLLGFASVAAKTGVLSAPIDTARVSLIDTRDIAAVAAKVLTTDGYADKTYTLTGPRAMTHAEIAETLSRHASTPITFAHVDPAQFAEALSTWMPAWRVDGLVEDFAHYDRGEAASVVQTVPHILGRQALSFDDFARDYASVYASASAS